MTSPANQIRQSLEKTGNKILDWYGLTYPPTHPIPPLPVEIIETPLTTNNFLFKYGNGTMIRVRLTRSGNFVMLLRETSVFISHAVPESDVWVYYNATVPPMQYSLFADLSSKGFIPPPAPKPVLPQMPVPKAAAVPVPAPKVAAPKPPVPAPKAPVPAPKPPVPAPKPPAPVPKAVVPVPAPKAAVPVPAPKAPVPAPKAPAPAPKAAVPVPAPKAPAPVPAPKAAVPVPKTHVPGPILTLADRMAVATNVFPFVDARKNKMTKVPMLPNVLDTKARVMVENVFYAYVDSSDMDRRIRVWQNTSYQPAIYYVLTDSGFIVREMPTLGVRVVYDAAESPIYYSEFLLHQQRTDLVKAAEQAERDVRRAHDALLAAELAAKEARKRAIVAKFL